MEKQYPKIRIKLLQVLFSFLNYSPGLVIKDLDNLLNYPDSRILA
jgi:hypothetical protein